MKGCTITFMGEEREAAITQLNCRLDDLQKKAEASIRGLTMQKISYAGPRDGKMLTAIKQAQETARVSDRIKSVLVHTESAGEIEFSIGDKKCTYYNSRGVELEAPQVLEVMRRCK